MVAYHELSTLISGTPYLFGKHLVHMPVGCPVVILQVDIRQLVPRWVNALKAAKTGCSHAAPLKH